MGGLFAPAYIKGYAPSEQAVAAWQAQHRPVTAGMIDQLRMPDLWQPNSGARTLADGVYGSGVPVNQNYAQNPKGSVDVDALRAASMGSPYDIEARRAAIAARIAENERLKNPTPAPIALEEPRRRGDFGERDPLQDQIDELNRWRHSLNTTY